MPKCGSQLTHSETLCDQEENLLPFQHIGLNAKLGGPQVQTYKCQLLITAVSDNKTKQVIGNSCSMLLKKKSGCRPFHQPMGAGILVACCTANIVQTSGSVGT